MVSESGGLAVYDLDPGRRIEVTASAGNRPMRSFFVGRRKSDFTRPVYTIALTGAKTYTLSFYKEQDNFVAGVSSENLSPFRLSAWRAKDLMKDFSTLAASR